VEMEALTSLRESETAVYEAGTGNGQLCPTS